MKGHVVDYVTGLIAEYLSGLRVDYVTGLEVEYVTWWIRLLVTGLSEWVNVRPSARAVHLQSIYHPT